MRYLAALYASKVPKKLCACCVDSVYGPESTKLFLLCGGVFCMRVRGGPSHVRRQARRALRWSLPSLAMALLVTGLPVLPEAEAAAGGKLPKSQQLTNVPGEPAKLSDGGGSRESASLSSMRKHSWKRSPAISWPKAETASVTLPPAPAAPRNAASARGKTGPLVKAGSLPVRLAAGSSGKPSDAKVRAEVQVEDRSTATKAGIDGLLLKVERTDTAGSGTSAATPSASTSTTAASAMPTAATGAPG